MSKKIILFGALAILLAGNLFFGLKYLAAQKELRELRGLEELNKTKEAETPLAADETKKDIKSVNTNGKIVNFTLLFIRKVLREKTEVSFETQMELDGEARALGDEAILAQWQKFINSQTGEKMVQEADNLLELLVGKMKI